MTCGLFAQVTLARLTFVTRATSTLVWQVVRTVQRTSHAGDAVVWSGRGTDRV